MKKIIKQIILAVIICLFNWESLAEDKKNVSPNWNFLDSKKAAEPIDERVSLLKDFLEKINSDKSFTPNDNIKFFGNEFGGLLGIALYEQLGFLDLNGSRIKWKKDKPKTSYIGALLQLNRKKIFPNRILHYHFLISDTDKNYGLNPNIKNIPFKIGGNHISYITILINGFKNYKNQDVTSRILLFRLAKNENKNKYYIELFGSYIDNLYFSELIGFKELRTKNRLVYELKKEELNKLEKHIAD